MNPNHSLDPQLQKVLQLHQTGHLKEALDLLRKLTVLKPKDPVLLTMQGSIQVQQGQFELGVSTLGRSLQVDHRQPIALFNRANGLVALCKWPEAVEAYDRFLAFQPAHLEAQLGRATALLGMNRLEEALAVFDRIIEAKPDWTRAHHDRGRVLSALGRHEEALESYRKVTALEPSRAEAYNNVGVVLRLLGRPQEALAHYDKAIALKPEYAEAYNNRGTILQELHRLGEAEVSHDKAIELKPDYGLAYLNKALLKLLAGHYEEGWKLYARRENNRRFLKPRWDGFRLLQGKTIFIHFEHGLGDVLQFSRYVQLLHEKGAKVILESPKPLVSVLSSLKNAKVVEVWSPLPEFDYYCPLMDLPMLLHTTLETIPASIPYLFVEGDKTALWQEKLGLKTRPRIGLVWSGNPSHSNDANRSICLEKLAPIWSLSLEFHSLQKEYREKDGQFLSRTPVHDHHQDLSDFSDTAALADQMDLIVSVDTSVAHVAGAIGKKVWVLLPDVPDYRWLLERSDNPWYPQFELFRKGRGQGWEATIQTVADRLKQNFQ